MIDPSEALISIAATLGHLAVQDVRGGEAYGAITTVQQVALAIKECRHSEEIKSLYAVHSLGKNSYIQEHRLGPKSFISYDIAPFSTTEMWEHLYCIRENYKGTWEQTTIEFESAGAGTLSNWNIGGHGGNKHQAFFDKEDAEAYLIVCKTNPSHLKDHEEHLKRCQAMAPMFDALSDSFEDDYYDSLDERYYDDED